MRKLKERSLNVIFGNHNMFLQSFNMFKQNDGERYFVCITLRDYVPCALKQENRHKIDFSTFAYKF